MSTFSYILFLLNVYLFAIIPFSILYLLSDFTAFVFNRIIGYRKKTIIKNLRNSFPDKSKKEINQIKNKFYRNLSDVIIEGIKGFSMSKKQLIKRFKVVNPELINKYYDEGESVVAVTGHINNWEWGALSGGLQLKHKLIALYKPLANSRIDNLLKRTREENGTSLVSIVKTNSIFKKFSDQKALFILVADQSPSNYRSAYWLKFLNQETACLHGPENYSKAYKLPVVYLNIQRIRRGYYTCEFIELIKDPTQQPQGKITSLYFSMLEEKIRLNPSAWLWSHRRWKKTRKEALGNIG